VGRDPHRRVCGAVRVVSVDPLAQLEEEAVADHRREGLQQLPRPDLVVQDAEALHPLDGRGVKVRGLGNRVTDTSTHQVPLIPRSTSMRLIDRLMTRMLGLPPARTEYGLRRDVPLPMRDGVFLLADHYVPSTSTPAGTLLLRCPYGRDAPLSWLYARVYAERGYHVVMQSVRGTFGSGGEFVPASNEVEDGADTVAWLRREPWFTGTFATVGQSYLGLTQWALLADPPPAVDEGAELVIDGRGRSLPGHEEGFFLWPSLRGGAELPEPPSSAQRGDRLYAQRRCGAALRRRGRGRHGRR